MRDVRRRTSNVADAVDSGCFPSGVDLVAGLALLVGLVFLVLVGIPLAVAVGELVLIGLVLVGAVVGRVLFRRPWTIEAIAPTGERSTWAVTGWRRSAKAVRNVADRVRVAGEAPLPEELEASLR
jgi:hypothetical protein